jgi:hypothetical protein
MPGFIVRDSTRSCGRGQTLLEILIAVSVMTIIFLFIAETLIASSRTLNQNAENSTEIAAANYYLGLMKSDSGFWENFTSGGPVDICGNTLTPYDDSFPSPPASPDWHPAPACSADPVPQGDPNHSISRVDYMWSASPNPNNGFAQDLTVWVKTSDATGDHVYVTRSIRYEDPAPGLPPTPTPGPSGSPPVSPPPHSPTPPPTTGPSPSPTPIGI